jgi:EAL domain-containing protein (putative c-di-GMP-specific phosphodiesterase class I)
MADLREAFGHTEGERLLLAVADRLRALASEPQGWRAPGGLVRWGGNSFLLVLDADRPEDAAETVLAVLDEPYAIAGRTLHLTGSAGVAAVEQGASPETALSRVSVAAGCAQREHDRVAVWSPRLAGICPEDLALVEDLRHAGDRGELTLAYQPIVTLAGAAGGRRVVAVEALLRWDHPDRGSLSPAVFVPLAERFGVTAGLTSWVLDAALRQLAAWRAAGHDLGIAVNLSPTVLHDGTCAAMVADALGRHGVPAASLTLEITETAVSARPDRARTALAELDALGVRLSLDDFGTGYTSLVMLDDLPLDEVKVDRAFVGRMLVDPARDAIACAIRSLCSRLGVAVVAEGVEDAATLARVVEAGFDLAQGFHVGRPVPAAAVPALLGAPAAAPTVVR